MPISDKNEDLEKDLRALKVNLFQLWPQIIQNFGDFFFHTIRTKKTR